jgi:fructose-specific phosphotransferase system component IIB
MKNKTVYLVAYYYMKPRPRYARTQIKGWMNNPDNVVWDEQVGITNKLKKNDIDSAKIILDLSERKIFRNSWSNGKSFDDLFEHFYQGYQRYLDPVIEKLGYEMVDKNAVATESTPTLPINETISSQ